MEFDKYFIDTDVPLALADVILDTNATTSTPQHSLDLLFSLGTPVLTGQSPLDGASCSTPTATLNSGYSPVSSPPCSLFDAVVPSSLLPPTNTEDALHDLRLAVTHSFRPSRVRKSKHGNTISPSPYRPHVSAAERLFLWTTPFSRRSQKDANEQIPLHLQALAMSKVANSVVDGTRSCYAAGLLRFTQFCDENEIPESMRMPASSILLAAFAASACGMGSSARLKNWMNGLAFWHRVNRAHWHGDEEWVPLIMRTSVKEGLAFRRPPRGPVTVEHLRALRARIDISTSRGAAIWAAALTAFWGCRRLGELIIRSISSFNPAHDVTRSTSVSYSRTAGRLVVTIFLPWTKTTGTRGGYCILTETGDDLCPVSAFKSHLRINHTPDSNTPLFAYHEGSSWSHLTKSDFLGFITKVFKDASLQHVFGHSFRIGDSVYLLCSGVEPEIVMKLGGWSSMCFLIYWRRLERIIPTALAKAWSTNITSFASCHSLPLDSEFHDVV